MLAPDPAEFSRATSAMRPTPTVAVIITSHNYRAYLGEALDSVLSQTYPASQILVVDDGSSDGSPDLVRERYAHEQRVRLITRENGGQLAAFATGVRAAAADIVAFLDADDVWEPEYLDAVLEIYSTRPNIDYISVNLRYFGRREGFHKPVTKSRDDGLSILSGCYRPRWKSSPTSGISMRRTLAMKVLRMPAALRHQWRSRADNCLSFGADILGGHKYFLARPLVRYRDHGGNVFLGRELRDEEKLRHWAQNEAMIDHYRRVAGLNPAFRADHLRHALAEFLTRPTPTRSDYKAYRRLLAQSALPWSRRFVQGLRMRLHYWINHYRG